MPWIVIVVIVIAVFAFGEWREWRGHKRGDAAGYGRAVPLIGQAAENERRRYLGLIRSLQWELAQIRGLPAGKPPETTVVLQLPDGTEIRQKAVPRQPK